jgi:Holliday junction resolvasome RuvABC endonuclease subunit
VTVVIGLDLSLTSTGIAVIDTATGDTTVERIVSKGKKDATLDERRNRLLQLQYAVQTSITKAHEMTEVNSVPLIVIEQPAFSRQTGHMHDRSGLWWLVVSHAGKWYHVAEVSPTTRAKYATGKGNAGKDAVLAAVVRRYPQVEVTGNDEADSLILAAIGARHLGAPIEDSLPQAHLAAMDAVRWPELTGGTR